VASLLVSLRPGQWSKNLILFAGLIFGRQLFSLVELERAGAAFVVFCALSGVVYLINDVVDRESDRRHPLKAKRPIASGELSPSVAVVVAVAMTAAALGVAFWLGTPFGLVSVAYVVLLALYSFRLKHVVIMDVLTIAIGFVLRAVAGAVVVLVPISQWLLVCTVLLALFLALSKRRHELVLLANGAVEHRPILGEYSPYLLDQMIGVVTASTLIAYIFYTINPETVQKFQTELLGLTIPFPLYGIFRYLYLVHRKDGGGSPAEMLLTDRPLLACVALWAALVVLIIYRPFALWGV
jgi:4-hydroxybenzoate polyprenyltransferase